MWEPIVRGGFDLPSVSPYDVACAVFCLDRLAEVDGERRWAELAADARAWFDRVDDRGRRGLRPQRQGASPTASTTGA